MDVQHKRQRRVRRAAIVLASMAAVGGTAIVTAAPAGAGQNSVRYSICSPHGGIKNAYSTDAAGRAADQSAVNNYGWENC